MAKRGPYNDLNTDKRVRFWDHMIARHPGEEAYARRTKDGMRWHRLFDGRVVVSLAIGIDFVRVFVRGDRGCAPSTVTDWLEPRQRELSEVFGTPMRSPGESGRFFSSRLDLDMNDERNWDRASDFLHERAALYESTLKRALDRGKLR